MKTRLAAVLVCLLLAPSCVKDVIMDANEKPKVAVYCILSDEPVQTLHISFTKGASKKEAEPVADAEARLIDKTGGSDFEVGVFKRSDESEWTLDYPAELGHTYRLEVSVPGYDLITAEQTMPSEKPNVLCHDKVFFARYIEPWSGWDVTWDPSHDWYTVRWPKDEIYPRPETIYTLNKSSCPIWLYAMNFNPETGEHELAEELYTNASSVSNNITEARYAPERIDNIPNPYKLRFEWEQLLGEQFYSAHCTGLYPQLAGCPMHESWVRFPANLQQEFFYVSGSFYGEFWERPLGEWERDENMATDKGFVAFAAMSDDLDKYLIEAYHFMQIQKSTDLSTIYLRNNIYSNVKGGLGIFGAKIERKFPWNRTFIYVDSGIPMKV